MEDGDAGAYGMSNVVRISTGNGASRGFGMEDRWGIYEDRVQAAAALVTRILRAGTMPEPTKEVLDAFSTVKGMFNRVHRQDQRDWFVTLVRLGYPTDGRSKTIGNVLGQCRTAVRDGDEAAWKRAREVTRLLKVRRSLAVLRGRRTLVDVDGYGFVYAMSNLDDRDLLAVGVTQRPILEEAAIVNAAADRHPMGVRAVWWVADVAAARLVLAGLTEGLHREDDGRYEANYRWFRAVVDRALAEADLSVDPLAFLLRVPAGERAEGLRPAA